MPGILQRKIGPFPGWVWGALAGGGFLVFMYMRGRGRTAQQGQQQQGLVNNPAASSIPYVPSVTVSGIPPQSQPGSTPPPPPGPPATVPQPVWQFGAPPNKPTVWRATPTGSANFQRNTGGPFPGGVGPGIPDEGTQNMLGQYGWQWALVPSGYDPNSYAAALNAQGGSGGYGYAGAASLASPIGGWTVGWQPFGSGGFGAGSTVNRTGPAKRPRRLFGVGGGQYSRESSGFPGGSGGGTTRQRQAAGQRLKRRSFSGR